MSLRRLYTGLMLVLFGLLVLNGCSSGASLPDSQRLVGQARVNMRSGNTYMTYEEYDLALERYLEVLDENPEYIEALKNIGDIYFFYAETTPAQADEYYFQSYHYYDQAIESYDKIQEEGNYPQFKEIIEDADLKRRGAWARLFNVGQDLFTEGMINESLEHFFDLSDLTPDSTNVFVMIATIYQTQGEDDRAADFFEHIAEIDPQDTVSRNNLALYHFNNQNYVEAISWYEELIEIDPNDPEVYYNIGFVYMNMEGGENQALEAFETAYELDNTFLDAVINAGFTAFNLMRYDKAVEYFKEVLEVTPDDQEVTLYLLYAFEHEGNYEEMLEYAQHLYQLDNQSIEAVQFIILAAHRLERTDLQNEYLEILNQLEDN